MGYFVDFMNNVWPVHMYFAVQLMIVEFLFLIGRKKRKYPIARTILATVAFLVLFYFHPMCGSKWIRVILIFLESVFYLWFVLDAELKLCIFVALASYAIQNLAYNCGDLLVNLLNVTRSDWYYYLITSIVFIAVYAFCYFFIIRRFNNVIKLRIKNMMYLVLTVSTIVIVYSKNVIVSLNIMTDYQVLVIFCIICCISILIIQFNSIRQSEAEEEKAIIEGLLENERKKMLAIQENINMINIKCHDLRHHVRDYQKTADPEEQHKEFFDDLRKSINFFETIVNTGNAALNQILSEKILYCNTHDIQLSYLVNKDVLEKISQSDVYSLFGNALDNAIESVSKEEDKNNRNINVLVKQVGQIGQIVITNYFDGDIKTINGMPVTSKKDVANHGYGFKSIKYIVDKYNGSLVYSADNKQFVLSATIPLE